MQDSDELIIFMKNIFKLRKCYGYTKLQMAHMLGISVCTLSKIEVCEFPPKLSINIVCNIHKHFGILPKDMFVEWKWEYKYRYLLLVVIRAPALNIKITLSCCHLTSTKGYLRSILISSFILSSLSTVSSLLTTVHYLVFF